MLNYTFALDEFNKYRNNIKCVKLRTILARGRVVMDINYCKLYL